jgi:rfaE bifunctional protein nucleotidyltransferase chain/domain
MTKIELIRSKICSLDSIKKQCSVWHFKGKKIVFTNGCFDLMHLGHIEYLSSAAELGDVLIVGLNTDDSVARIKGHRRPITDEHSRAMVLAAMRIVNAVVLFDEDTPYELISMIQPDILVKGGDYLPKEIVGYDIVTSKGGNVITIPLTEGYSTSKIEERIIHAHKK